MNNTLNRIQTEVYNSCFYDISSYKEESESQEYAACRFIINGKKIICRDAKVTPKKAGQFVTFWKRINAGPIEPFTEADDFDLYVVNVVFEEKLGQFIFPKTVLIKKGIISTDKKEGKRAFRVYPFWDNVHSKQAERSQKWQLNYFVEIDSSTDITRVKKLYQDS